MLITIFNKIDSFLGVSNLYQIFLFSYHPFIIESPIPTCYKSISLQPGGELKHSAECGTAPQWLIIIKELGTFFTVMNDVFNTLKSEKILESWANPREVFAPKF